MDLSSSSPSFPRFRIDQMLIGPGRRLRLLGYDCESVKRGGPTGSALLQSIRDEERVLLTCSRSLFELDPLVVCLLPPGSSLEQVRLVVNRWPLPFGKTAFTRCANCNSLIEPVDFEAVSDRLPFRVRELHPDVTQCPHCHQLYWEGTHTRALRRFFSEHLHLQEFTPLPPAFWEGASGE